MPFALLNLGPTILQIYASLVRHSHLRVSLCFASICALQSVLPATMSDTTNGVHANGYAAARTAQGSKHEEMQYLDMIRDIMARGQVRVRGSAFASAHRMLKL